jgi:hypothetical protein
MDDGDTAVGGDGQKLPSYNRRTRDTHKECCLPGHRKMGAGTMADEHRLRPSRIPFRL